MIQQTEKIYKLFLNTYPELNYNRILLTNEELWLPELKEVEKAIKRNSVIYIKRYPNITECEAKAWYLLSGIHKERSIKVQNLIKEERITFNDLPEELKYRWAFGWCTGWAISVFQIQSDTMCWVLTRDKGLKIINPETNQFLDINIKKYSVFLVVG